MVRPMRGSELLTGPLGSKVLGSATWSAWSFIGRASRVERKVLAKDNSVIVSITKAPSNWWEWRNKISDQELGEGAYTS